MIRTLQLICSLANIAVTVLLIRISSIDMLPATAFCLATSLLSSVSILAYYAWLSSSASKEDKPSKLRRRRSLSFLYTLLSVVLWSSALILLFSTYVGRETTSTVRAYLTTVLIASILFIILCAVSFAQLFFPSRYTQGKDLFNDTRLTSEWQTFDTDYRTASAKDGDEIAIVGEEISPYEVTELVYQ